jgi:hypothetical protein
MDVMELGTLAPEVIRVSGTGEGMHLRTRCNQPTSQQKCTLYMASVGRGKKSNSLRHASLNGWMGNPPVVRPTLQGPEDAAPSMGRILTLPPFENDSGWRCPHRQWEWIWNGDEDVATPFTRGAVPGGAPRHGAHLTLLSLERIRGGDVLIAIGNGFVFNDNYSSPVPHWFALSR